MKGQSELVVGSDLREEATAMGEQTGLAGTPISETSQEKLKTVTRQGFNPIQVLLVVRMKLIRRGLAAILSTQDDLEVVAEVGTFEEALPVAQTIRPAAIIIDLLSDYDVTAASQLCELSDCSLLALVEPGTSPHVLADALKAGIKAFCLIDTEPDFFCEAIRRGTQGEYIVDPLLLNSIFTTEGSPLTPREMEVLQLAATGMSTRQIAERLIVSPRTVDNHISSIMVKLYADNRIQAIHHARARGWI